MDEKESHQHLVDKLWFRLLVVGLVGCFISWALWMKFICVCTIP